MGKDGASETSCDPHTKNLLRGPGLSIKLCQKSLKSPYLSIHDYVENAICACSSPHEKSPIPDFSILFIIFCEQLSALHFFWPQ